MPTPPGTDTHAPMPHAELVDHVRFVLKWFQHDIAEEHHGVTADGARYFGCMTLRGPSGDYSDTVGLRNSHDKTFAIGLAFGSRVIVCDNLAFSADHVIRRKHTTQARRELPALLADIVRPLAGRRDEQSKQFITYKQTPLTIAQADHAILTMKRDDVIGWKLLQQVMYNYSAATHRGEANVWGLFNAVTAALRGRVVEHPNLTTKLHRILNGLCREKI